MNYVSLPYLLIFLPGVLLLYRLLPVRHRWKLLLAASYGFFYLLSKYLIIYLLLSTASIHHLGLWLEVTQAQTLQQPPQGVDLSAWRKQCKRKKGHIVAFGVILHIGLLLTLKYFSFFGSNVNVLLGKLSSPFLFPTVQWALPIGISFFTLQAVSYIIDVSRGTISADHNLGRLALYMSFFPIIMEGPICRYQDTAQALYSGRTPEPQSVSFGAQRIIWGLCKKLIIADRLAPMVNQIFDNYSSFSGLVILVGAVSYTVQLYADFSGCIDMTIGAAQMFGVTVPENFRQPFFARTASEFWRRWHITLGTWLKDYIFYPLSLTKGVKKLGKKARKTLGKHTGQVVQTIVPLFFVWLCNGLWHGTGWNYIFFGLYYFVLILIGNFAAPVIARCKQLLHINPDGIFCRILQTVKMLAIIITGELFFRANGFQAGLAMFRSIFHDFHLANLTDGTLLQFGLDNKEFYVALGGVLLVIVVGVIHERGISIRKKLADLPIGWRWGFYLAAILLVMIFGAYGNGYAPVDPLYAGF